MDAVASKHERFPLAEVTFAGLPLANATVDLWIDEAGRSQWAARVLVSAPLPDTGRLVGRTKDGRAIEGDAFVAGRQMGPGGRRQSLVELHGSGELEGWAEAPE